MSTAHEWNTIGAPMTTDHGTLLFAPLTPAGLQIDRGRVLRDLLTHYAELRIPVTLTNWLRVVPAVLVLPPQRRKGPGPDLDLPIVAGAIQVDKNPWEPNPDLVPTLFRADVTAPLAVTENNQYVYFWCSERLPVKWVMAGAAGFGVSADDEITGVIAEKKGPWVDRLPRFVDRQRTNGSIQGRRGRQVHLVGAEDGQCREIKCR